MTTSISIVSHWLCYANSAVNPVIYNFMSGKYRKEFQRTFGSCLHQPPAQRSRIRADSTLVCRFTTVTDRSFTQRTEIVPLGTTSIADVD
ncbi:neuropeptide FF receptor 2-like [Lycorma delicatula]|uniref:neuropeptide FF receptor 2-like n=1 Tax=Lycorma delicatula TaxID=130591 RepID=UPI003F515580